MHDKKTTPDFGRWAVTGVIAPVVTILILAFAIAPFLWPIRRDELFRLLGIPFIIYLIFLACAATVWKIWHERRQSDQPKDDNGPDKNRDSDQQWHARCTFPRALWYTSDKSG